MCYARSYTTSTHLSLPTGAARATRRGAMVVEDSSDEEETGGIEGRTDGGEGAGGEEGAMRGGERQAGSASGDTGRMGEGGGGEGLRGEGEGHAGAREGGGGWTREERDVMDSYAVPDGFQRIPRPSSFPNNCIAQGLHVLMRFMRTRAVRVDGQVEQQQWCEWSLGKVTKQRATRGFVDILWDDVGRMSSKLNLDEYGGGHEDGPTPTWVFCKKL